MCVILCTCIESASNFTAVSYLSIRYCVSFLFLFKSLVSFSLFQSGLELEAVTRINTMCNGQQLSRFVTKPTADMISHVQEDRTPNTITWSHDLDTNIDDVNGAFRKAEEEVLYLPPILKRVSPLFIFFDLDVLSTCFSFWFQRDASHVFPFNDEPLLPVVLRRSLEQVKVKTLADVDPSKV